LAAELHIPTQSLPEYFLERIRPFSDRTALVCAETGRTRTYAELARRIRAFAGALRDRGLAEGDVAALWSANHVDYPAAFHGAVLAGATVTLVGAMASDEEVQRQLGDSAAHWLVAGAELAARASRLAAMLPSPAHVIVLGQDDGGFERLCALDRPAPRLEHPSADTVAALPYSSGTTGLPKGVMLTHRNLVANLLQVEDGETLGPGDVALGLLPFAHIYGLTVVMNMTLARGATLLVVPRFEPAAFLQALQDHGVTRAYLAPPLVLFLARHPLVAKHDLSRLRCIISGAAPLDAPLARDCASRVGAHVIQGYGLTETSPGISRDSLDPALSRPGSIGRLLPATQARVLDPGSDREVEPGQPGELWIRGPQVMKGYLHRPDATADMVDAEGWLRTGDLVTQDQDGWLFVSDRLKELIKCKGYQVAPSELEALLRQHPQVRDCAVIGRPDEEAGEVPVAFVVAAAPVEASALLDFVASRVAPYKKLRAVEFTDAIPKSPAGKILRRVLAGKGGAAARP
jgi:acyl-CoA synthetase (AMP-forming)/AMP-acid ligase II